MTPLACSIRNYQEDIAKLLLTDKRTNVNQKNDKGVLISSTLSLLTCIQNTALHFATEHSKSNLVELVLAHPDINVNITNDAGVCLNRKSSRAVCF